MSDYSIEVKPSARQELEALPDNMLARVLQFSSPSRINSAQFEAEGDAVDGHHVSGDAVVDVVLFSVIHHIVECGNHDGFQALIHHGFLPKVSLPVLHPLEIGHRHATGIRQNIGDDEDAAVKQNIIRRGSSRTVSAFHQDARLDLMSVLACDDALGGGGYDKNAILFQDFLRPN